MVRTPFVVGRLRLVGIDAVRKRDLAIDADGALDPLVLALVLGLGLAADGQHVVFQLDLHLVGLDPRELGGQLDGVAAVAHLHAWHADHAAIALGGAGGQHGVEQRRAEEVALHALEQRVQHRERILVLPRRQATLAAVAGFLHRGRLALVLTLALLVGHGRLLSVIHRWRERAVDPSTPIAFSIGRPPVSHGPEEVARRPTDGTSRRPAIGKVTARRQRGRSRDRDVAADRAGEPRGGTIFLSREIPATYDLGRRRDADRHADRRAARHARTMTTYGYTNVYLASADRTTYAGPRMAKAWRTGRLLESNVITRTCARAHGVAPKIFRAAAGPVRLRPRPADGTLGLETARTAVPRRLLWRLPWTVAPTNPAHRAARRRWINRPGPR